mgnify:CR=1 FL=1
MDQNHKTKVGRQGLLLVFPKLLSIVMAVSFLAGLAGCSKDDPTIDDTKPAHFDLRQVDVDLRYGLLTGTTAEMEYSLNSTNGTNGTWTAASDGSTTVTLAEGRIYVREAANPSNVRLVKTIGPGMIIIIDLEAVGIDVAEGQLLQTTTHLEYSLNSTNGTDGDWTRASADQTAVEFVAGHVYVREAEDHSNVLLVTTIAPAAAAPELVGDDDANSIIGLAEIHEYKIDGGTWTEGTTVPDLAGTPVVQIRVKATASALASEVQTISFTEGPVWFENFASYATGPMTFDAWRLATSGSIRTVFTIKTEGSDRYLELRNGSDILCSPNFSQAEYAVVEWKMRINDVSNILVTGYGAAFDATGTTLTNSAVMRLLLSTTSGNTSLRGYGQDANTPIVDVIASNIDLYDQWVTFRIEIIAHTPTTNHYKVYMNGNLLGATDGYATIGNNKTLQHIRIRNLGTADNSLKYVDFGHIKVTAQ